MLYTVVLTFESVDEILMRTQMKANGALNSTFLGCCLLFHTWWCYSAVLSCVAVGCAKQSGSKLRHEIPRMANQMKPIQQYFR